MRVELLVVNPRVEALVEDRVAVEGRRFRRSRSGVEEKRVEGPCAGQFGKAERQEVDDGGPAGQSLAHGVHEVKLPGTGKDEPAGRGVCVHDALKEGQQIRRALYLVQNGPLGKAFQEPPRVMQSEVPLIRVLERHIGEFGERCFRQGRFPRLSGAGERHDGIGFAERNQLGRERPFDHAPMIAGTGDNVKLKV